MGVDSVLAQEELDQVIRGATRDKDGDEEKSDISCVVGSLEVQFSIVRRHGLG